MFVLKAGMSLYSATGVRKLAPGAVVRQVGKIGANKVLIEDAGFSGETDASNLTRDSTEIAAIRKQNREK